MLLLVEMLNVVLNGENYLFDRGELDCFARYSKLPCVHNCLVLFVIANV